MMVNNLVVKYVNSFSSVLLQSGLPYIFKAESRVGISPSKSLVSVSRKKNPEVYFFHREEEGVFFFTHAYFVSWAEFSIEPSIEPRKALLILITELSAHVVHLRGPFSKLLCGYLHTGKSRIFYIGAKKNRPVTGACPHPPKTV